MCVCVCVCVCVCIFFFKMNFSGNVDLIKFTSTFKDLFQIAIHNSNLMYNL